MKIKERFGIFFHKKVRPLDNFLRVKKYHLICGYRAIEVMIGDNLVSIVYKFN